ncbi:MAG: hypothetical protein HYZ13_09065 [Acidobacteria bacterium]|nr:hypothetical protein [Acidobacteriota bacterium]
MTDPGLCSMRRRHPWDELRRRFVQGEEVDEGDRTTRRWPSTGDLAATFGIHPSNVSKAARKKDPEGRDWYGQREAFKRELQRQVDVKAAQKLAEQEIRFRVRTYQVAERLLGGVERALRTEDHPPDNLSRLANTARRAQELGMVALDRAKDGPVEGLDDWTLMRRIRQGARLEDLV